MNNTHSTCENHRNQAKVQDPFTSEWVWVCEGCGANCGEATAPAEQPSTPSASEVAERHADWAGFSR